MHVKIVFTGSINRRQASSLIAVADEPAMLDRARFADRGAEWRHR